MATHIYILLFEEKQKTSPNKKFSSEQQFSSSIDELILYLENSIFGQYPDEFQYKFSNKTEISAFKCLLWDGHSVHLDMDSAIYF